MFKKSIATIASSVVILGGVYTAPAKAAVSNDLRMIPVIVNGYKVKFPDTEPYINTDGRTMVPVRFVSEKLGSEVKWDGVTETVTVEYKDKTIVLPIGSSNVKVNGETVVLDTAAELYEGRTMVPLRFVSEVLGSKVTWDNGAHAVQVTDVQYQAKIAAGEVGLDPWGRELSKTWDANWIKLSDLPEAFYKELSVGKPSNREYTDESRDWDFKTYVDQWAERIRQYYAVQLNVDYRTIDEEKFVFDLMNNMAFRTRSEEADTRKVIKDYVAWVKKNKVIARGYADPENSQVRFGGGVPYMPAHFKFVIISAEDTAQTFLDNWDVSDKSDSFKLKKNVWYDGYSDVMIGTNYGNMQYEHYALRSNENMFVKGFYTYEELN